MDRSEYVEKASHWVVKIGSNVLLRRDRRLNRPTFVQLVEGLDALLERDKRVTVVSSGAVALGRERLRERLALAKKEAEDVGQLQALAALGQSRLIQMYADEFSHYGRQVAQVLFSRDDLSDRQRYLNARTTLSIVHQLAAIPIINENDTVATEELRFGDNDQLAAMTCGLVGADLLVILSDVEGVYEVLDKATGEDRAQPPKFGPRIGAIASDEPILDQLAGPSQSGVGTGGMVTKVIAARIAARFGVPTLIASGRREGVLQAIASGEDVGTLIFPRHRQTPGAKKVWLGASARTEGRIWCDAGACRAVADQGASLLPKGVTAIEGDFDEGAVVELLDPSGHIFARGISVYCAPDVRRIAGRHSGEIEDILEYKLLDAVVHRDAMVVFVAPEIDPAT